MITPGHSPTPSSELTAIILAGGLSQRMGQDKALMEVAGTPLLRQTWDIARTLAASVWIVTSRVERYRSILPPGTQWILEPPPTGDTKPAGPLVAFAQALPQMSSLWILLLSCDLPGLRAEVMSSWVHALPHVPSDAIAYLPCHPKGWAPLCGFYRRTCLSDLNTYIAAGGRSFQSWLGQHKIEAIPQVPPDMLVNCNTPQDWNNYCLSRLRSNAGQ